MNPDQILHMLKTYAKVNLRKNALCHPTWLYDHPEKLAKAFLNQVKALRVLERSAFLASQMD